MSFHLAAAPRFLRRLLLFAAIILVAAYAPAQTAASVDCQGQLPAKLKSDLSADFPKWTILDLTDLAPDFRDTWLKEHPGACPGLSLGGFKGPKRLSYAVLLSSQSIPEIILLMVDLSAPRAMRYEQITSFPSEPGGNRAYIYRLKPGTYTDLRGKDTAYVTADALVLAETEKTATLYYFEHGRFREMVIAADGRD